MTALTCRGSTAATTTMSKKMTAGKTTADGITIATAGMGGAG